MIRVQPARNRSAPASEQALKVSGSQVLDLNVSELLDGVDIEGPRRQHREEREDLGVRIFISYALKDEDLRAELDTHLKLMQRQRVIAVWHDRQIPPGQEWEKQIDEDLVHRDI